MTFSNELFFMGNKRSGTSLLVRLLNLHPDIFATHESDIVWLLYQMRNGWPPRFDCYPWDGPIGMRNTLEACEPQLRAWALDGVPASEIFQRVNEILRRKSPDRANEPGGHRWLGEKKPVQQCDPDLRPFMLEHFPRSRYLHIVRDPRAVVASMTEAARSWPVVPEYWKGSPAQVLERWAIHEEWVLQAKATEQAPILTFRFEDLCAQPAETMQRVFQFLDLDCPASVADRIRGEVQPDPNRKWGEFALPSSPRAEAIMARYGYA